MADKTLVSEVARINRERAMQQDEIELNQPYPEEVASESSVSTTPTATENKGGSESSIAEKQVGGYSAEDLLKSPISPPDNPGAHYETEEDTRNPKVKLLLVIGLAVVVFGALLGLLVSVLLGSIIAVLGAGIITYDVFGRVK